MTIPFLYQLQDATYSTLTSTDFRIGVIDLDDSGLTAEQVGALSEDQGKILLTYLSIGEAEDYRDYWQDGNWSSSSPDFLLGENPDWAGNYLVEFWNPEWQQVIFDRVDEAIKLGYSGIYLDIVDAYDVAQVKDAYLGTDEELRQEMIDFVIAISEYAKQQDPDFMVVPQNAVGLLALDENNPDGAPNTAYLDAIDGLGVEDLWYDGNKVSAWTNGDLEFIQQALDADKFVLATSYPTQDDKQDDFLAKALDAGLIPFVADRDLTGIIDPANSTTDAKLENLDTTTPWSASGTDPVITDPVITEVIVEDTTVVSTPETDTGSTLADSPDAILGTDGDDQLSGTGRSDILSGLDGKDTLVGRNGADFLFGGDGNDILKGQAGDDTLYGGNGADRLLGGAGADIMYGGAGKDRLVGGNGDDILYGGENEDVFHFDRDKGNDTIKDFQDNIDLIELDNFAFSNPFDFAKQVGTDVVFAFDTDNVLTVEDTTIAQLQDDLVMV